MGNANTKVFMSYSRHDEALVKPLAYMLAAGRQDSVFVDIDNLQAGDYWRDEIEDAIGASAVFVLCWCCESKKSEFVRREIQLALKDNQKRIVPVLFCSTPLPEPLANRQWVDLRGRVLHSCKHGSSDQHCRGNVVKPKRMLSRRHRRIIGVVLATVAVLALLLTLYVYLKPSWPSSRSNVQSVSPYGTSPYRSEPEASNWCVFYFGPDAGGSVQLSGPPQPVGSRCTDPSGANTGTIRKKEQFGAWADSHAPSMENPDNLADGMMLLLIIAGIGLVVLVCVLVIKWLFERSLYWIFGEPYRLAALATNYFEEFPQR